MGSQHEGKALLMMEHLVFTAGPSQEAFLTELRQLHPYWLIPISLPLPCDLFIALTIFYTTILFIGCLLSTCRDIYCFIHSPTPST